MSYKQCHFTPSFQIDNLWWNSSFVLFYQVLYRLADGFKPSYPFRRGVAFFCLRQRKSFVSNLHLFFFRLLKRMAMFKVLVLVMVTYMICVPNETNIHQWHHVFLLLLVNWHTTKQFYFLHHLKHKNGRNCDTNLNLNLNFPLFFRVSIQYSSVKL